MKEQHTTTLRSGFTPGLRLRERKDADGGDGRTIEGYAILFDTPSLPLWDDDTETAREIIDPAAVTKALLDTQDIKMTLFHNRELILARSNKGAGTLAYAVDEKGVRFAFDAPRTADGDKAVELVRRGDLAGCSFAFSTRYGDPEWVSRTTVPTADNRLETVFRVKKVEAVYDFTLAADPAYPETEAAVRELREMAARSPLAGAAAEGSTRAAPDGGENPEPRADEEQVARARQAMLEQWREMRRMAAARL